MTSKAKFVAVDEDTAKTLQLLSEQSGSSSMQIVRDAMDILKFAMGRQVVVEGKKKTFVFDWFKNHKKLVDMDD